MKWTLEQLNDHPNRDRLLGGAPKTVERVPRGAALKATDGQLVTSYLKTKSLWKTANEFGMCGQSVHERLHRLGLCEREPEFTEEQELEIRSVYASGIQKGDGKLGALAIKLGKSIHNVCRWARRNGLTLKTRTCTDSARAAIAARTQNLWKVKAHPKGMLGKKHTQNTKDIISEANLGRPVRRESIMKTLKTKQLLYGNQHKPHGSWKAGWREIGGQRIYARSRWEANYARYLEFLRENGNILQWEHEPDTFWFDKIKRGTCSYLPDFKVTELDGNIVYHEVKGWMDARSKTKIRRMKKYHPTVKLVLIDSVWYKTNARKLNGVIPGWETKNSVLVTEKPVL